MNEFQDFMLVRRAQSGEREAFELLLQKYEKPIYYSVLKALRNKYDADDCLQEILCTIVRNINTFDLRKAKFNTWVYTLTDNQIKNYLKKKKNSEETVQLNNEYVEDYGNVNAVKDKEIFSIVEGMLNKEEYRILIMRFKYNMKFDEISKMLDVNISTLKRNYYDILERVKKYLNGGNE